MNELDGLLIKATSGVLGNPIENCIVITSDAGHFGLATSAAEELASLRSDFERAIKILAYLKSHNDIQDSEIDALLDKYMDYPKEEKDV